MKGPKVTPYSRCRSGSIKHIWKRCGARPRNAAAIQRPSWVTVLAPLYGTGLRRGELERLNMDAFDRGAGTLRIDGRKSGQERCVPLPEMVLRCLEAYSQRHNQLERFGRLGEEALLVSRGGVRLTGELSATRCTPCRAAQALRSAACISFVIPVPPICWRPVCTWHKYSASWATPASPRLCVTCTSLIPSAVPRCKRIRSTIG